MNYQVNFGRLAGGARAADSSVFGIALLGDFSGHANAGKLETGDELAARKPHRVDVDNVDDIVGRMGLNLCLPVGEEGGAVEVEIGSMDDFHPDELYENVEAFAELSALRKRLQKASTYESAAAEVRGWASEPGEAKRLRPKARGAAVPNAKLSDFARLMGAATATAEASPADELIKQIVGPYITPSVADDQAQMVAAVDSALSALMRRVLHHPDFQAVESLWRSVDLLTRELETGTNLQIVLYDISAEELAADLSAADDLTETGLYKLLVEQPAHDTRTTPPSVIVGAYQFEQTPPHADLLGRMAKVASAAGAPFVASLGADAITRKKADDVHPAVSEAWDALRSLPESVYLGLVTPRFMLRWPYGASTDPIDPFDFEEFTPAFGLKGFLWGYGSVLAGLLLGKTFQQQGMKGMKLGSVLSQGELPLYYYTDADGDQVALPCTERLVAEADAAFVTTQGLIPVCPMRGRPEVRLGGFGSVAGGTLAGPWGAVAVASPAAEPEVDDDDEFETDDDAEEDDFLADDIDEEDEDDGFDQEGDDDEEDDAELDALLASLDSDEEDEPLAESDDEDDDEDMDPELAALLADL